MKDHSPAAARRQKVAHSVSCELDGPANRAPAGAAERFSFAPTGAWPFLNSGPTAHAVGYFLSRLRRLFPICVNLCPTAVTPLPHD